MSIPEHHCADFKKWEIIDIGAWSFLKAHGITYPKDGPQFKYCPFCRHDAVKEEMAAALKAASMFIKNGIALGFIRMPDPDVQDPAKIVPGMVDEALAKFEAEQK